MRADICDDVFDGFCRRRVERWCLDDYSEFEGVLVSDMRVGIVECFNDGLRKCVTIEGSGLVDGISGDGGEVLHTAGGGDASVDIAAGGVCCAVGVVFI